ncbi:MAG: hypothetical protein C4527_15145 [Candidatus Omnitrophota bacterium]|jgi:hypothetical protein|nr:MAG: hypothetical protein C4527_15145 [Candidatus Omnitrophota bacterium]
MRAILRRILKIESCLAKRTQPKDDGAAKKKLLEVAQQKIEILCKLHEDGVAINPRRESFATLMLHFLAFTVESIPETIKDEVNRRLQNRGAEPINFKTIDNETAFLSMVRKWIATQSMAAVK